MARMLGRFLRPSCPHCRSAPGPDCDQARRTRKRQRQIERRQWLDDYYDYKEPTDMSLFQRLKDALHHVGGMAEADAHALAEALHPVLEKLKDEIVADVARLVAEGRAVEQAAVDAAKGDAAK